MWLGRFILTGLLICYFLLVNKMIVKYHNADKVQLYRVDTFHLFTRAYEYSEGRNSDDRGLKFRSTNGYYLSISNNAFYAIKDRKMLEDTLMYHDIKFTVFTNRKHFEKYRKSKEPIGIPVYQIQIGDTQYIDTSRMFSHNKSDRLLWIIVPPIFIFFFAPFFFYKNFSWWTKKNNHLVRNLLFNCDKYHCWSYNI